MPEESLHGMRYQRTLNLCLMPGNRPYSSRKGLLPIAEEPT
jgi:hypothetical protein